MSNFYRAKVKVAKNNVIEIESLQGTSKRAVALDAMRMVGCKHCQYVHVAHVSGSETRFRHCVITNGELDCTTKE